MIESSTSGLLNRLSCDWSEVKNVFVAPANQRRVTKNTRRRMPHHIVRRLWRSVLQRVRMIRFHVLWRYERKVSVGLCCWVLRLTTKFYLKVLRTDRSLLCEQSKYIWSEAAGDFLYSSPFFVETFILNERGSSQKYDLSKLNGNWNS